MHNDSQLYKKKTDTSEKEGAGRRHTEKEGSEKVCGVHTSSVVFSSPSVAFSSPVSFSKKYTPHTNKQSAHKQRAKRAQTESKTNNNNTTEPQKTTKISNIGKQTKRKK